MKNLIRKILREDDWDWAREIPEEILKVKGLTVGNTYQYLKDADPTTKSDWRGPIIKSDIEGIPNRHVDTSDLKTPSWVDSIDGREFQILKIPTSKFDDVVIKWSDTSEVDYYTISSSFFEWGRFLPIN